MHMLYDVVPHSILCYLRDEISFSEIPIDCVAFWWFHTSDKKIKKTIQARVLDGINEDVESICLHYLSKARDVEGSLLELFYLDLALCEAKCRSEVAKIHIVAVREGFHDLISRCRDKIVELNPLVPGPPLDTNHKGNSSGN